MRIFGKSRAKKLEYFAERKEVKKELGIKGISLKSLRKLRAELEREKQVAEEAKSRAEFVDKVLHVKEAKIAELKKQKRIKEEEEKKRKAKEKTLLDDLENRFK